MIETGTLLQDRYLIEKQIGVGGMGAVYVAVDQRFGSYVAIKETFFMDEELGEAFEREAHLLNSLFHPVLPHVSDYFKENNGYFLVMQYIEGEDLSAILKREGAFPVKDVLRWTDSLLDALDYLHSQEPPIIHRDIKPQNLKITPRGDVILLDFGLAKLKSEDTTGVKSVFGYSRKYSPLEQIQGTGTDARSDIFSLGATTYHLLTGNQPIDVLARASAIVAGNPDPLQLVSEINSEVPVSVANVLNSALALNPAVRFVSAKAMRHALENAVKDLAENIEEAPEQSVAPIAADKGVVISPETENFPALDAFVAEVAGDTPQAIHNDELIADEALIPPAQISLPVEQVLPQSTGVRDVFNKDVPRYRQSRFLFAALAALIICAGLAAAYFINKSSSSNQSSAIQSAPETNPDTEQSTIDADAPEAADLPVLENTEQAKTKPLSIEKAVEKKEIVNEPVLKEEITEKSKPVPMQNEIPRPAQNPHRNEPQRRNQTSPRVAESEPVPDIESIFTGRSSRRNSGKRRQQIEDISEEELREIRRQRREERRRRKNRNNFPF